MFGLNCSHISKKLDCFKLSYWVRYSVLSLMSQRCVWRPPLICVHHLHCTYISSSLAYDSVTSGSSLALLSSDQWPPQPFDVPTMFTTLTCSFDWPKSILTSNTCRFKCCWTVYRTFTKHLPNIYMTFTVAVVEDTCIVLSAPSYLCNVNWKHVFHWCTVINASIQLSRMYT